MHVVAREGWEGWDEYAPFYDWENARTLGRRDVPFWRRVARRARGPCLELGCGTGRISLPLARAGVSLVGIDRSAPMLARARHRVAPAALIASAIGSGGGRPRFEACVRGRHPRAARSPRAVSAGARAVRHPAVAAARPRSRGDAESVASRSAARRHSSGSISSPTCRTGTSTTNRVQLQAARTAGGAHLTLVESVRQDRARRLTDLRAALRASAAAGVDASIGSTLTFRTLSVPQMTRRLERAGFRCRALLGDYRGRPWDERADVWIILAGAGV